MVFCIICCIPRIRTRKRVVRAQPGYVYEVRRAPCPAQNVQQMRPNPSQQPLFPPPPPPMAYPPPVSSIPQKNHASAPYPSEPPPPYTRL